MFLITNLSHRHPWLLAKYRPSMDITAPPSMAPCEIPSIHGHNRTAIHGSLRNTTAMDGGSADFAGAKICPSFLYIYVDITLAFKKLLKLPAKIKQSTSYAQYSC
jgi:hypothetical protein